MDAPVAQWPKWLLDSLYANAISSRSIHSGQKLPLTSGNVRASLGRRRMVNVQSALQMTPEALARSIRGVGISQAEAIA